MVLEPLCHCKGLAVTTVLSEARDPSESEASTIAFLTALGGDIKSLERTRVIWWAWRGRNNIDLGEISGEPNNILGVRVNKCAC